MRQKTQFDQNRVFLVLWESSENQFGRPKKKVDKIFENFWKSPPPLEKILDPALIDPIFIFFFLSPFILSIQSFCSCWYSFFYSVYTYLFPFTNKKIWKKNFDFLKRIIILFSVKLDKTIAQSQLSVLIVSQPYICLSNRRFLIEIFSSPKAL